VRDTLAARPGGLVVAAYDTELLGHWWHEGPTWLGTRARACRCDPTLRTTTLASRVARRPPTRRLDLPESSWGYAKGHASWVTDETRPVWVELRDATALARTTLAGGRGPARMRDAVARELALLHASDWPFMMTRGRSPGYALDRVRGHAQRVHDLCAALARGADVDALDDGPRAPVPPDASEIVAALDPSAG
jgi:1,4-alpha-glucan branching enzyme